MPTAPSLDVSEFIGHWDKGRVRSPGGSSSGEAAAVGGGGSVLGIGSYSDESLRVPASWCGVCTLKPSAGRVPITGHFRASANECMGARRSVRWPRPSAPCARCSESSQRRTASRRTSRIRTGTARACCEHTPTSMAWSCRSRRRQRRAPRHGNVRLRLHDARRPHRRPGGGGPRWVSMRASRSPSRSSPTIGATTSHSAAHPASSARGRSTRTRSL